MEYLANIPHYGICQLVAKEIAYIVSNDQSILEITGAIQTVKPCAMSSSGTSSGRNCAGVIQGSEEFWGSKVTITSPLAEDNSEKV